MYIFRIKSFQSHKYLLSRFYFLHCLFVKGIDTHAVIFFALTHLDEEINEGV